MRKEDKDMNGTNSNQSDKPVWVNILMTIFMMSAFGIYMVLDVNPYEIFEHLYDDYDVITEDGESIVLDRYEWNCSQQGMVCTKKDSTKETSEVIRIKYIDYIRNN
jgi:hypothetical protein